ncbi:MAG: DUF4270 domain-containing protein [Paludibacteraceae bacterium]|nr:DUF4270 domain-containing protein [Paludibacteraceae bacterium]
MRNELIYSLVLFVCLAWYGCDSDSITAGISKLESSDEIIVKVDTFGLRSSMIKGTSISVTPDSLLLGECDGQFGTMRADILTQFACPLGYKYPENATLDSVEVFMYYSDFYGDGNSPMSISVYEIDKQTIDYTTAYYSDADIADFCSLTPESRISTKDKVVSALNYTDSVVSSGVVTPYIRIKLTDEFAQKLFAIQEFKSQKEFNEAIKGIYITTNFGSATMLYIKQISMMLHYSFTYNNGVKDTTVRDIKGFYANHEVRQINRYEYNNAPTQTDLDAMVNTTNYIVSPANIYTVLHLPFKEISDTIQQSVGSKRPYVNRAAIRLNVLNVYEGSQEDITRDDWAQPAPTMLMIKKEAMERFFQNKELPADSVALYSELNYEVDAENQTSYYYKYDLSSLLTEHIRKNDLPDTLHMVLVPVTLTTNYSSSYGTTMVTSVALDQRITVTKIPSAQQAENPMQIEVVYSGF